MKKKTQNHYREQISTRRIDSDFKEALRKAVYEIGSQSELARRSGVSQPNIARYLSGIILNIRDRNFQNLIPFLDLEISEMFTTSLSRDSQSKNSQVMIEIFNLLPETDQKKILKIAFDMFLKNKPEENNEQ